MQEIKNELLEEIEEAVGKVTRIEVFEENPVCKIKFETAIDAEKCVKLMHGRWFDQRQLECFFWDGKTDYKKASESAEI